MIKSACAHTCIQRCMSEHRAEAAVAIILVSDWLSAQLLGVTSLSSGIVVLMARSHLDLMFDHRHKPLRLHGSSR